MDCRLEGPAPGTRVAARGYKLAGWVLPVSRRVAAIPVPRQPAQGTP
jgi:hypothetical protein